MGTISDQQHRILDAVHRSSRGWCCNSDFHAVLYGRTWPRESREIPPLTNSQMASLSRTLRRLVGRGLLLKTPSGAYMQLDSTAGLAVKVWKPEETNLNRSNAMQD